MSAPFAEPDDVLLYGTIPVAALIPLCDPLDGTEWDCDPIVVDEVMASVQAGVTEPESWQTVNLRHKGRPFDDRAFHVRRLAHLVTSRDDTPIQVEVEGFVDRHGDTRRVRIFDGSHRLGASSLRGDEDIAFVVRECDLDALMELLPEAHLDALSAPAP